MSGFNELIPPDLVNVFEERELELRIGGIADIDVDDWKKHTDYRGYTEQDQVIKNFWTVSRDTRYRSDAMLTLSDRSSGAGTLNRNLDCFNSPQVPHESRSMVSRIFKAAMDRDASPSKSPVRTRRCLNHTRGELESIIDGLYQNTDVLA